MGWKRSWNPSARAHGAPFPPAFEQPRRHRPAAAQPVPESALRPALPRACAATSGAAKNGGPDRAWRSWHPLAGRAVAGSDLVALVELIAAHFALRLGAIVGVHERLHPRQHLR